MKKILALFMIPILVIISGCVSDQSVPTPTPTENVEEQSVETIQRPTEDAEDEIVEEQPIETDIPTHNIGDSANDNNTKITLNSVIYAKNINDTKAEEGNQFVIVNITIENIGKDVNIAYIWPQFTLIGSDIREGMPNDVNETASAELKVPFDGEEIGPGDKRQGELAFQIPEGTKDLKFKFDYSPESSKGGESEIFILDG